jgi:hypothetical protein
VSGGFPGQREAIHAYHFPLFNEREAAAPAPNCVDGMPTNNDGVVKWYLSKSRLYYLFERMVRVTGFNLALVLVPKSPLSLFNAFACSHYAAVHKGASKSEDVLLKTCVDWLLTGDCFKTYTSTTGSLSTLQESSQTRSNSRRLVDVWCEIMLRSDDKMNDVDKVCRMRKHIQEISFKLGASYKNHFPLLNELFIMVLCVIYRCTVTVLDNPSGKVCTYRTADYLFTERHHLIVVKVEEDEYFGIFNLNDHV